MSFADRPGGTFLIGERLAAHYILTRFNVRLGPDGVLPDEAWLHHRLHLFQQFCVPSLMRQQSKSFFWLLFVDAASPSWIWQALGKSVAPLPAKVVRIGESFETAVVAEAIRSHLPAGVRRLVTTRLDNDDALSFDFTRRLQESVRGEGDHYVNFSYGFQFEAGRLYARMDLSNPFISLAEDVELTGSTRFRTIFVGKHRDLRHQHPVTQLGRPAGWLQVIHDQNRANLRRGVRKPADRLRRFGFETPRTEGRFGTLGEMATSAICVLPKMARDTRDLRRTLGVLAL